MGKIIGIDLGTTNSRAAVIEGGKAVVIANAEGERATPSVVAFSKDGRRMVGQAAKRQAVTNPDRTVSSIRREMGGAYNVAIDGRSYSPQEISAMILQKLKADAEAYLGQSVTGAVITVPAHYTSLQRQATIDAGRMAGLDVKRIISGPNAAALACGIDKEEEQYVMVCDLGGGGFDVSIMEIGDGLIQVLTTAGSDGLGGDDFDRCVVNWMLEEFKRSDGIDLSGDKMAMQRLREAAEKAKTELSGAVSANISLPYIAAGAGGPKRMDLTLTRAKFNELTARLVEKAAGLVRQVLSDFEDHARRFHSAADLSKVLLVGGSSRIPAVRDMIKSLTGKDGSKGVNPDECAAIGVALYSGFLNGDIECTVVLDVIPLSLGIETSGGVMTRLEDHNSTVPILNRQIFSTAVDDQTSIEVHVLQGESEQAAQNVSLGRFKIDGIAPAPSGVPQIEVALDVDYDGIVSVSAKNLSGDAPGALTVTRIDRPEDEAFCGDRGAEQGAETPPPPQAEPQPQPEPQPPPDGSADGRLEAVLKLLPVYDSLTQAVQYETDEAKRQGSQAILKQYRSILAGMGVEPIKTVGYLFDPRLHDALEHITDARYSAGAIVRELETGFIMDGKVIRFAKVVVAN